MDTFIQHENKGVVFMTAPNIPLVHAFSTRLGGVSAGPFASLNLGFGRGDPAGNVMENYRRLGAAQMREWVPHRLVEEDLRRIAEQP